MIQNKAQQLQEMLFETLIRDLEDPIKCTPGLYQVVRGVVNDNKEDAGLISTDSLEAIQDKMTKSVPFKFGG